MAVKLRREINAVRETLFRMEKGNKKSMDCMNCTLNCIKKRILKYRPFCWNSILHMIRTADNLLLILDEKLITTFHYRPAMHILLSPWPLPRDEIPQDVLGIIIDATFDRNISFSIKRVCQDIATKRYHQSALWILAKYGAKRCSDDYSASFPHKSCIIVSNINGESQDLLTVPQNLQDSHRYRYWPLHEAIHFGDTTVALQLVNLGANVDERDLSSKLPIWYFLKRLEIIYTVSYLWVTRV